MDVNHLLRTANHQGVYSNGGARVVRESPIGTGTGNRETPSVIYHGLESSSLPDAGGVVRNVYEASTETNDEASARLSGVVRLLSKELGNASADLKYSYDSALNHLSAGLADKDWGFSISGGELTVVAGSDALSEQETNAIRNALLSAGAEYSAGMVSSTVIEAIELDRGPAGVSNGIGRFDVSEKNFGDVVDLRQYLQSHAPGGKYGQHRVDPSDIAGLFYTGGQAMMDQVAQKAEENFVRPSDFGRLDV